jgi:hypothetical protein
MRPRLKAIAFTLAAALAAPALAQAPTAPPTNPATGTGATPGAIPPGTAAPGPAVGGAVRPESRSPATGRAATDFGTIDTNRDGFISRAEASSAGLGGPFATLDKNNDGRLDPSEHAAHRGDNGRIPGMQSGTSPSTTGAGTTTTR